MISYHLAKVTSLDWVISEYQALSEARLEVYLFGGWAKELLGGWTFGDHRDLDLLVVTDSLTEVDDFISKSGRLPCSQKYHPHKRGYFSDNQPVEIIQVTRNSSGLSTLLYGNTIWEWSSPLGVHALTSTHIEVGVASRENIVSYEQNYSIVEQAFYSAYPEVGNQVLEAYGCTRMVYHKFFVD